MCITCAKLVLMTRDKRPDLTIDSIVCNATQGYYKCNNALKPLIALCEKKGMPVKDMPNAECVFAFLIDSMNGECDCGNGITPLHHFADLLIDSVNHQKLHVN